MEILFEDDSIIVCYKPAGVPTQTKSVGLEDLETQLIKYRAAKKEKSEIFVVHRLDQPVEGVMVFAKTKEAAASLSKQVNEHSFKKKYYAVVVNDLPDEGCLEDYLIKDAKNNMAKVVKSSDSRGKKAKLSYKVVGSDDKKKMIDIELFTGRYHQIRVQLSNINAPILGDAKYGGQKTGRPLALCSHFIGFNHPKSGNWMEYDISPKGEDFF